MLCTTVAALRWIAGFLLLAAALNLKDPHLLPVREIETPVILLACAIGAAAMAWQMRRSARRARRIELGLLLCLLVAAAALTLFGAGRYQYMKHQILASDDARLRELGRHFIVGYIETDQVLPLVDRGLVGGVFITQRNVRNESAERIARDIGNLQDVSKRSGFQPLLVATDQEGGIVSRLSPPLAERPPLSSLADGKRSLEQLEAAAYEYGERQGEELSRLGITVNFAPVVDLKAQPGDNPLDFHSLIARRAISSDETIVSRVALGYARGLEKHGVTPTLKHFPGLGRVVNDTHHFAAELAVSRAELESKDWVPFRYVLQRSGALLMVGHVTLPGVDPGNPASFSRNVVQGIIRAEWKHEGALITDDLTMGAAYGRGLCSAAVKALNAGVDLLLVSYDAEKYYEAMYCAAKAYRNGELDREMLDRSNRRLAALGSAR